MTMYDDIRFLRATQFFVNKKVLPLNGQDTIELLDYLLYLRDNETEDDAISELQEVITDVCSA